MRAEAEFTKLLDILSNGLKALKIDVASDLQHKLINFIVLLDKWNQTYNLTAIRKLPDMVTHHLLDSIVAKPFIKDSKTVLDIGTGAGVPGIPLAIIMPNSKFTLLDSSKKKLKFVKHAINCLELTNVEVMNSRVEDYQPVNQFDLVMTRAFASLEQFVTVAGNLSLNAGVLLAYKGDNAQAELEALPHNFKMVNFENVIVPNLHKNRCLVFIARNNVFNE